MNIPKLKPNTFSATSLRDGRPNLSDLAELSSGSDKILALTSNGVEALQLGTGLTVDSGTLDASGEPSDGVKGDIDVSDSGAVWMISDGYTQNAQAFAVAMAIALG